MQLTPRQKTLYFKAHPYQDLGIYIQPQRSAARRMRYSIETSTNAVSIPSDVDAASRAVRNAPRIRAQVACSQQRRESYHSDFSLARQRMISDMGRSDRRPEQEKCSQLYEIRCHTTAAHAGPPVAHPRTACIEWYPLIRRCSLVEG